VGSARIAALVMSIAAAAPAHAHAFGPSPECVRARCPVDKTEALASPASLGAAFEVVVETAAAVRVEPPEPEAWFPVRGTIDFGAYDARFGAWRGARRHEGQDVFAPAGTPLVAIRDGSVVETGDDGGRGNYVAIWSPEEDRTFVYLHMRGPTPHAVGDRVEGGARVGAVGCTGSCWGDHLHLEMRAGRGSTGKPLDPLPLLQKLSLRAR
jgi:murein DD-endopeptidase MepM/ murein hydrolase activator NlpD